MDLGGRVPDARGLGMRGGRMREPDDVAAMVRLHGLGWGIRRIAAELGCSHMTVRRYVAAGEWAPYRVAERVAALDGHTGWIAERFRRHRGNADVVRQDLARELGIEVSLRTVERAVAPLRRELLAEARATVRFETPPGKQLQIDFGEVRMPVEGETGRVFLFVATLGYSRRLFVRPFRHERQSAWFDGLEGGFSHFGGVPEEVLLDNARALVTHHDAATREVLFNERFRAFAAYWHFRPQACAPFRARTKGKDERGVGYVKRNAIAGHRFRSWAEMEAHLVSWARDVADVRIHGTTGEAPLVRFERDEAAALRPLNNRAPFRQIRELARVVHSDGCVEIDTNRYSVPWRLIGAGVTVRISAGEVVVLQGGTEVARHGQRLGRRETALRPGHLNGIVGTTARPVVTTALPPPAAPTPVPELLRPLADYEQAVGGGW
jgi:transposase